MTSWNQSRKVKMTRCTALACAVTLSLTATAQAETGREKAKTGAKGTVGLALLGAETVMSVEALIGVKPWWGYVLGGGLGAVAGGVGGYFIDRMDKPAVSMGLLAGGLTLAIPATVAILAGTAYRPPKNPEVDTAEREDRDLALVQSLVERHASSHEYWARGLLSVQSSGQVAMNLPELDIVPVYSMRERQMTRLVQLKDGPNAPSFRSVVLSVSF